MSSRPDQGVSMRYGIIIACIAIIVYAVPGYLNIVAELGHQIPETDLSTDYVKALGWAFILCISIFMWPVSGQNKRLLLWGWLAKVVVTLSLMLFYEGHYGLDSYYYFEESRLSDFNLSDMSFFHADSSNLESIARIHRHIFPDSYHAMKVSFAMLGLIGIYLFYRAAVMFLRREEPRLFYLLAFFPGIIFWSSILGKDPIVFFGIALYAYGVSGWYRYRKMRFFMAICCGITVATFFRVWLGVIMVFPMGMTFILGLRGIFSRLFFAVFAAIAGYFSAIPFLDRFKIDAFQDLLDAADRTTTGYVKTPSGSAQVLNYDFSTPGGFLSFLPYGAFTALFRPFPGEVLNPFGLLAGIESFALLILLAGAIIRTRLSELKEPLILWALLFALTWSSMNGLVSSTNFGVAVRYRLQVLPVLICLLMYLARKRQQVEVS